MTDQAMFYRRAEEWLYRLMELNPVLATQLGDYRWNDRLGDNSPEAVESQYRRFCRRRTSSELWKPRDLSWMLRLTILLVVQLFDSFVRQYRKTPKPPAKPQRLSG